MTFILVGKPEGLPEYVRPRMLVAQEQRDHPDMEIVVLPWQWDPALLEFTESGDEEARLGVYSLEILRQKVRGNSPWLTSIEISEELIRMLGGFSPGRRPFIK